MTKREKNLSVRQRRFISAYLTNGMNATQAYRALGYTGKNAETLGSRMVQAAQAEIDRQVSLMGISPDFVKAKTYQHCNSEKERISLEALRLLAQCLRMFEEPARNPSELPPMIIIAGGDLLPPQAVTALPASQMVEQNAIYNERPHEDTSEDDVTGEQASFFSPDETNQADSGQIGYSSG